MKKWTLAAGGAAAAVLALGLTLFRPSEEDRIRKVLDRFANAVEVKANDNIVARAGRVKSELRETVADDVHVDVADLDVRVSNRAALADSATKASLVFPSARCDLTGLNIKVDDNATTAKVDALAIVTGELRGAKKVDNRPVHFLLRKDSGDWRITTIDVAATRQE